MQKNQVLVIAGPTASGKSALAMDLAKILNGVIINSDSIQIYQGIPIIAASPSPADKAAADHRLYEIYPCEKCGNVIEWLELCVAEIRRTWQEKRLPIVVGGTGMYTEALVKGATPIPEVAPSIRQQIAIQLQTEGLPSLYKKLQQIDGETAAKLSCNDKTRIVRALEIYTATGKKVSAWYKEPLVQKIPEADFVVVKIIPELEEIAARCCQRLEQMVYKNGALKEIESLLQQNISARCPAQKALGVPELIRFIQGEVTLEQALQEAKLHTRQYAKRQRTWLRNRLPAHIVWNKTYNGQAQLKQQIINVLNTQK